ncbi:MAG: hypothetical protein R2932_19020 [Caldilineaceae bacterium]
MRNPPCPKSAQPTQSPTGRTHCPLFARIHAGESCAVVGAASMGKSRLLQFILRPDVATHYLAKLTQANATPTLLLWIDCNRMAEVYLVGPP